MRWSKLRQLCEQRMAPALDGRVRLHAAGYTDAHDDSGRAWITIDGVEVATFCNFTPTVRDRYLQQLDPQASVAVRQAHLHAEGVLSCAAFHTTLQQSLQLPFDAMLRSDNLLLRSLAMLDRRLGKRRLRQLTFEHDAEHPLVYRLYTLRCDVEGLTPQAISYLL